MAGRLRVGQTAQNTETFDAAKVRLYTDLHTLDFPRIYTAPDGVELVPPGLVMFHAIRHFATYEGPIMAQNGIFVEGKRRYLKPVPVGEAITFEGELIDKYLLRGFHYIITRWHGTDSTGDIVVEGLSRNVLGFLRDDTPAPAPMPRYEAFALTSRPELDVTAAVAERLNGEVGKALEGRTLVGRIPPPQEATNTILRGASLWQHEDELAQRAGFRGGMVINEFHLSHLFEMLLRYFGIDYLRDGEIEVKFTKPLLSGESMTPRARIVERRGGRLHLDLSVENGAGERIAIGVANCKKTP
jgi:acyl dehydratase